MTIYIPFRHIFQICRFHNDELINEDGSLQCTHPSCLAVSNGKPGVCSSNCIAKKILETVGMPWSLDTE